MRPFYVVPIVIALNGCAVPTMFHKRAPEWDRPPIHDLSIPMALELGYAASSEKIVYGALARKPPIPSARVVETTTFYSSSWTCSPYPRCPTAGEAVVTGLGGTGLLIPLTVIAAPIGFVMNMFRRDPSAKDEEVRSPSPAQRYAGWMNQVSREDVVVPAEQAYITAFRQRLGWPDLKSAEQPLERVMQLSLGRVALLERDADGPILVVCGYASVWQSGKWRSFEACHARPLAAAEKPELGDTGKLRSLVSSAAEKLVDLEIRALTTPVRRDGPLELQVSEKPR